MPEIGTSGSMSGERRRSVGQQTPPPRLSSTLPHGNALDTRRLQHIPEGERIPQLFYGRDAVLPRVTRRAAQQIDGPRLDGQAGAVPFRANFAAKAEDARRQK